MIDNQLVAQILFENKLATEADILASWPLITQEKDVAAILVEKAQLSRQTYEELLAYMQTLQPPTSVEHVQASEAIDSPSNSVDTPVEYPQKYSTEFHSHMEEPDPTGREPSPISPDAAWSPAQSEPTVVGIESKGQAQDTITLAPKTLGPTVTWQELLAYAREFEASDIHLSAGNPILLRRYGSLTPATEKPMEQETLRTWVQTALDPKQLATFESRGDLEFIYTLKGWGRYRVTVSRQRRGWELTARVIPSRIRSMEESELPEQCRDLTRWAQGLVLVTGPVGCGKSSTLATFVELVNQERHDHIISIEEPIEILYTPANCRITQREIGLHTLNQEAALRAAMREDPDIIVISELRDLETIRLAISAAETGHLVFGTMNTTNAARTIYRLIDSFPPEEQGIIRSMISESLRGIVSQQLIQRKDGTGMVPAYELLLITSAVSNMIRKDEGHQLGTAMITGKSQGMVLLDDSLRSLVERGLIDPLEAMSRAFSPKDFEKYIGRRG